MQTSRGSIPAQLGRGFAIAGAVATLVGWSAAAYAQAGGAPPAPQAGVPGRGVLGGVPMTAADSAVKAVVDRLEFESYKGLLKGLTQ